MSFLDAADALSVPRERGGDGGGRGSASTSAPSAHQQLSSVVFQLTTHVSSFRRLVDTLGTYKDTEALRERLAASRDAVQTLAREASAGLKQLHAQTQSTPDVAAAVHAKLVKDFQVLLKEFQAAQQICLDREAMYTPHASATTAHKPSPSVSHRRGGGSDEPEGEPLLDVGGSRVEMLQLQGEVEYNDAVIMDRQQGIEEIHEQILEVNEIFKDLAVLVSDQGGMLDDIEANMVKVSTRVHDGTEQLRRADKTQRSSRNRMLCLLIFFLTILVLLIVVLIKN